MRDVEIDGNSLTLDDAVALSLGMANAVVSDDSKRSMYASRSAIAVSYTQLTLPTIYSV